MADDACAGRQPRHGARDDGAHRGLHTGRVRPPHRRLRGLAVVLVSCACARVCLCVRVWHSLPRVPAVPVPLPLCERACVCVAVSSHRPAGH
jgi:hypothetical protein